MATVGPLYTLEAGALTPAVLRYSPYNKAVKEVIDSGALGDIVNIKHIEPVGNQHFAHSFVRGNWHKEADTSFGLMTKCCQWVLFA